MKTLHGLPAAADSPIALTIGKFDGVHLGHRAVIEGMKREAGARALPACLLTFDPHPVEFFLGRSAPARLTTRSEKIRLLERQGIDRLFVCPFDRALADMSPEAFVREVLVERLGVRSLWVGKDFRFGARRLGDLALLHTLGRSAGLEVAAPDDFLIDGLRVSSTAIRSALAAGDTEHAARLLGRDVCTPTRMAPSMALSRLRRQAGEVTAWAGRFRMANNLET